MCVCLEIWYSFLLYLSYNSICRFWIVRVVRKWCVPLFYCLIITTLKKTSCEVRKTADEFALLNLFVILMAIRSITVINYRKEMISTRIKAYASHEAVVCINTLFTLSVWKIPYPNLKEETLTFSLGTIHVLWLRTTCTKLTFVLQNTYFIELT